MPHSMWDLSSRPGTETVPLAVGAWSIPWTAREVPSLRCFVLFCFVFSLSVFKVPPYCNAYQDFIPFYD